MKQPLAFSLRPSTIDEVIGQTHLLGPKGILRKCVLEDRLFSMIFFGPPGSGKTSVALAMVAQLKRPYGVFNAVTGNKKELDQYLQSASLSKGYVLIMDEVHRLNKDKQDHLLPYIEDGTITLIGATTANPYFAINPAIRSRTHLFEFYPLDANETLQVLQRAFTQLTKQKPIQIEEGVFESIIAASNGDVRYALNVLEVSVFGCKQELLTKADVAPYISKLSVSSDSSGDGYYDLLSGFQKSIRGSDVDAALYYLARLIQMEDLESITRRLLVTAYEDIGLANPAAVSRVLQAVETAFRVGLPEARIPLSVAVIEMAASPKSKSANLAIDKALKLVESESHSIPTYLRITPVGLSEDEKYPYDKPDIWPYIGYLPNSIKNTIFYQPSSLSPAEKIIFENVEKLRLIKKKYKISDIKKGNSD